MREMQTDEVCEVPVGNPSERQTGWVKGVMEQEFPILQV